MKPASNVVREKLPVKKSNSVIYLGEISKTSVKFNVKDENCVKDDSHQNQENDLRAERDTDRNLAAGTESNMKNPSYQTVSNVQTMAGPNNKATSEMVGWKNTTMQQESTTTETSKVSSNQELKSNVTLPDISDSTDITINTAEYKEFLKTISKTNKGMPYYRYPNFNKSTETITTCEKYKVPVNSIESTDIFYEKDEYSRRESEEKPFYNRRINPLIDVPLNISKATLYTPTFFVVDHPKTIRNECDHIAVSKRSLFVRVLRTIVNVIACCQNYAYKYVLRFILFI